MYSVLASTEVLFISLLPLYSCVQCILKSNDKKKSNDIENRANIY